ncbi:MAG: UvrD-helicase domain-containing protein, partial [Planctomycetaceae bacterium]
MNNPADGSDIPTFLSSLNPRQLAAAMHGTAPLLIIAGAGTGKTTTLAHRVAWQVASGTDPASILLLTFTRRAAAEMLRRVEQILSTLGAADVRDAALCQKSAIRRMCGGTFHSAASALLRRHGHLIGLHPDFTIM